MYPRLAIGAKDKDALAAARNIVGKLGLEKYESKAISCLDTYYYRKASLARALVNEPWMVFVDEPFSELNHQESDLMAETLAKINHDFQVAVVVATNDPVYLSKSAISYLMDTGRIVDFEAGENPVERLSKAIENIKKKHGLMP